MTLSLTRTSHSLVREEKFSGSFTWNISNISQIGHEFNKFESSPTFQIKSSKFSIHLYLGGHGSAENKATRDHKTIGLFLNSDFLDNCIVCNLSPINFTMACGNHFTRQIAYWTGPHDYKIHKLYGIQEYALTRDQILQEAKKNNDVISITVAFSAIFTSRETRGAGIFSKLLYSNENVGGPILESKHRLIDQKPTTGDVFFHVGDYEFPGHRCILAARSPFFETMFTVDMAEKRQSIISIEDVTPQVFAQILRFIYMDDFEIELTEKEVDVHGLDALHNEYKEYKDIKENKIEPFDYLTQLLMAADRFQLYELVKRCCDTLATRLTEDNVIFLFNLSSSATDMGVLNKACFDFFTSNKARCSKMIACGKFKELSKDLLMLVMTELCK